MALKIFWYSGGGAGVPSPRPSPPEFKNKIIAINKLVIAKPKIIIGNLPILSERKPSIGVKTIPAIVNNARWIPIKNEEYESAALIRNKIDQLNNS